jgi:hypothetical protein
VQTRQVFVATLQWRFVPVVQVESSTHCTQVPSVVSHTVRFIDVQLALERHCTQVIVDGLQSGVLEFARQVLSPQGTLVFPPSLPAVPPPPPPSLPAVPPLPPAPDDPPVAVDPALPLAPALPPVPPPSSSSPQAVATAAPETSTKKSQLSRFLVILRLLDL